MPELEWAPDLPETDGLYVWRDLSMIATDGGPVGGLVIVIVASIGWSCKDGLKRTVRGYAAPILTLRNKIEWLLLSPKVDNL
jgi:hypothetical protein